MTPRGATFAERMSIFHGDSYAAVHTLEPVLAGDEAAFYTVANDESLQRRWAQEKGMPRKADLDSILLAQIEEHRTEVFYTLSTTVVDSALARRMPGCVRAKIGFHAAPYHGHDMSGYLMVNNFPTLLAEYRALGLKTAYFAPSHDPSLDRQGQDSRRDIDVLFVGTFSRWHTQRAGPLEAVAALQTKYKIVYSLTRSRMNRLAETPFGWAGPLKGHRRPRAVRAITVAPVFGQDYNRLLCRAKIVLNGAGDIGGEDRGNMRCWEALGARAMMVSDAGNYPDGWTDGETMRTYANPEDAAAVIESALRSPVETARIAKAGYDMVRTRYSKTNQWRRFQDIVALNF